MPDGAKQYRVLMELLNRVMERGIERGLKRGQEEGISALVELCQEFGMTLVDTVERVCNAYGIAEPESRSSVEKYWKG